MSGPVGYERDGAIAWVRMEDGKANVMSLAMLAGLADAFTQAATDGVVVVLTGQGTTFSAGYDTAVFTRPIEEILATMQAGGELVEQILAHPLPVVGAANGHAIAQGAFTLLACDVRLAVYGDARIGLNEVAIGLTIPHYGVELARHQLAPAWFDHATLTGTLYGPEGAQRAGFVHELVAPDDLETTARARATMLSTLDVGAHAGTKARVRGPALAAIRHALAHEFVLEDGNSLRDGEVD